MRPDRLTDLYRTYGPVIYARCRVLLADDSAAEDATQETFVRVCRHLDKVPSAPEGLFWIYGVATNYCLNQLRDRRGHARSWENLPVLVEEIVGTAPDKSPRPSRSRRVVAMGGH